MFFCHARPLGHSVVRRAAILGPLVLVAFGAAHCSSSAAGGAVDAADSGPSSPSETGGPAAATSQEAQAALESAGFAVAPGHLGVIDTSQCCSQPTCFGNNPSSPYAGIYLPPGPGQTSPNPGAGPDGTSVVWKLRADEAIVYAGTTPPRAQYFGFTPYLFDRAGSGKRDIVYASLGDTLNNLGVWTSGTPKGGPGDPFAKQTVIIASANRTVETRVRGALQQAGFDASIMNTLPIPGSLVHAGLDEAGDTFQLLQRVALFEDDAAGKAYLASPGGTVLRVTPKSLVAADDFPVAAPRPQDHQKSEQSLSASLAALRQAITTKYAQLTATDLNIVERTPYLTNQFGSYCIQNNVNCNGDNRDTVYPVSDSFFLAAPTAFVIVFGVNHQATGKATYSSFSIYDAKRLMGVASVDSRKMKGSAQTYLPNDPNADQLYAWKIARSCGADPHCLEVANACPGIATADAAFLAVRAYLEPSTGTGPDPSTLLIDGAIHFR